MARRGSARHLWNIFQLPTEHFVEARCIRGMSSTGNTAENLLAEVGWIRKIAGALARNDPDADDLTHDTWVALLRAPPSSNRPARPWLRRVLQNTWSNQVRSRHRTWRRDLDHAQDHSATASSPEDLLAGIELQKALATLILNLEEPFRRTVLLRYYKGLSSKQIASEMDVPCGTVRSRLKTALDAIRTGLDQRYPGGRNAWLAALAPFTGTPHGRFAKSALAGGVALLTIIGIAGFTQRAQFVAGEFNTGTKSTATAVTLETIGTPRQPRPLTFNTDRGQEALQIPVKLDQCIKRITAVRTATDKLMPEYLANADPGTLFDEGEPNPVAESAILAPVNRIVNNAAPDAETSLTCKTFACRLVILEPNGADSNRWMGPFQRDPDPQERTSGMRFGGARTPKDPVSGVVVQESVVHLRLASASGARVSRDKPEPVVYRTYASAPLPSDARSCEHELQNLQARMTQMQRIIENERPLNERFADGERDQAREQTFGATVREVFKLPPDSPHVDVRCQGDVCRVAIDSSLNRDDIEQQLYHREINRQVSTMMIGHDLYIKMADPETVYGMDVVVEISKRVENDGAVQRCYEIDPREGQLLLIFHTDGTPVGDEGSASVTAVDEGALSSTKLARCMLEAARIAIDSYPLPEKISGARFTRQINFPPKKSARAAD